MSDTSFSSILDIDAEDIPEYVPLPVGTYVGEIQSMATMESQQKKTPGIRVVIRLDGALEDVDPEALELAGGLVNKTLRKDFWFSKDQNKWSDSLRTFLVSLGGGNLKEIITGGLFNGKSVKVSVSHEMREVDGETRPQVNVGRIVAA